MSYRYCLIFLLLLSACSSGQTQRGTADTSDFHPDERPLATTLVYDCNGFDFIARVGPGEIALWLPDQYLVLSHVRSGSGALYEEGDITFWSKGDEAMLTVGDKIYQNCYLQPQRAPWEDARRRGVDFRAVGNEPGWHLEVKSGQNILFVSAYGMQLAMVSDPAEASTGSTHVYSGTSDGRDLQVEIVEQPCVDTMSGAQFTHRVSVTFENTVYEGCGQNLEYPWEDLE